MASRQPLAEAEDTARFILGTTALPSRTPTEYVLALREARSRQPLPATGSRGVHFRRRLSNHADAVSSRAASPRTSDLHTTQQDLPPSPAGPRTEIHLAFDASHD